MPTLYIEGGTEALVRLDGPSLIVVKDGTAQRRYPFQRISDVVLLGQVLIGYEALVECVRRGIPVTALNGRGAPMGYFLPWQTRNVRAQELVESFLAEPQWKSRYSDWLNSARQKEILAVAARLGNGLTDLRPDAARHAFEDAERRRSRSARQAWKGFLSHVVREAFTRKRLNAPLLGGRRPGLDLIRDFTDVLSWRHFRDFASRPLPADWPEAVRLFEAVRKRDSARSLCLVDSFLFWIGGLR